MPARSSPEALVRRGIGRIEKELKEATVRASRHSPRCECEYFDGLMEAYRKSLAVLSGILATLEK